MDWLTFVFPAALIVFLGFFFIYAYIPAARESLPRHPAGKEGRRITRRDRTIMLAVTLVYAAAAFLGLGSFTDPQTFHEFRKNGESVVIELREPTRLSAVMYYSGLYSGAYDLELGGEDGEYELQGAMEQAHGDLFKWQYAELKEERGETRFVRITADRRLCLGELALYDGQGRLIPADELVLTDGTRELFDEQDIVPAEPNYLNSAYFDEIYHARTAYEHIKNIYPYEVSHPPLGKLIISLGIMLFGMTPFGWRFMGTLFGVMMLPVFYVFLKKMFRRTETAAACTVVFAFDFMHFTQTRIATIDTYAVFFIILMYMFMYLFLISEREGGAWHGYLALSGVFFGLGAASKWTCLYAGAGLGVLWLGDRVLRLVSAKRAGEMKKYVRETAANIGWCLIFFIAVPLTIYYLSYFRYATASGMSGPEMFFSREYLDIVLDNQKFMFTYHSGVNAEHPYSSRWYQWIFDIRPILYYLHYFEDGTRSSFGAFVSPALCWGGLMAMCAMVYRGAFRRDGRAAFILVGYLAQLLPWVFITRITFEYHYFPSTVFLTLALGDVFSTLMDFRRENRKLVYAFAAVSLALFLMFYPVISGVRIPTRYASLCLRWIPNFWPF